MSVRQGTRCSRFPDEKPDAVSHTKHTAMEQGARTRTQDLMPQRPALPRNLCPPTRPDGLPPRLLLRLRPSSFADTETGPVRSGSQELRHPVALRPSSRWGFSTGWGLQRPLCTERASLKATPKGHVPWHVSPETRSSSPQRLPHAECSYALLAR